MASGVTPKRQAMARQVLGADGDHPAVEVLALDLDHGQEPTQQVTFGAAHGVELGQVDRDLVVAVPGPELAPGPGRALSPPLPLPSPLGPQRVASSSWGRSWSTGTS